MGLQSVKRGWEGNSYDVPVVWGTAGTHIHPDVGRQGIGRRLLDATRPAAEAAGLQYIDARIASSNAAGLG